MDTPVKLFISYAHEDEEYRKALETHLSSLRRLGIIEVWHDRDISAGADWSDQIDENLNQADIILLLISADFIASDYCNDIEMERALERHKAKEDRARVIPVIIRPVDWDGMGFTKLEMLPKDAKPIAMWTNPDEAFSDVAKGIKKVCKELRSRPDPPYTPSDPADELKGKEEEIKDGKEKIKHKSPIPWLLSVVFVLLAVVLIVLMWIFWPDPPPNTPPVAVNDEATVVADSMKSIPVLENDADPDGEPLKVISVSRKPANGSARIDSDTSITYEPRPGYIGGDTFSYVIQDEGGGQDTAAVAVMVTSPINTPQIGDTVTVTSRSSHLGSIPSESETTIKLGSDTFTVTTFLTNMKLDGIDDRLAWLTQKGTWFLNTNSVGILPCRKAFGTYNINGVVQFKYQEPLDKTWTFLADWYRYRNGLDKPPDDKELACRTVLRTRDNCNTMYRLSLSTEADETIRRVNKNPWAEYDAIWTLVISAEDPEDPSGKVHAVDTVSFEIYKTRECS